MPKLPFIAGGAAAALVLAGLATTAGAAPWLPAPSAASPLVLIQDEENAEVQNLLEPESDEGTPMNAEGEGEKAKSAPDAGGESAEKALEGTVGDDGINQIQEESIPE